jgi:hypothetical protein
MLKGFNRSDNLSSCRLVSDQRGRSIRPPKFPG